MKKQILVSTIASLALVSGLQAGSSTITAGSDINGSVHSAKIAASTTTILASDSNMTTAAGTLTADGNAMKFITYTPNIAIGSGNLITVKINNGAVLAAPGNNLWLVDLNSTAEQNATGGAPVVASMTDFITSGANYQELTFKFTAAVNSGSKLALANIFDTNATLVAGNADAGLGVRTSATGLVINAGLNCAENVTLEVVKSKDQSGQLFEVPNTNGPSSTGVLVTKGIYIELGAQPGGANVDGFTAKAGFCPTFSCTISIPDAEKSFGSATGAGNSTCPTCTDTVVTNDYTCDGAFTVKYNNSGLLTNGGVTITSVDLTTNGTKATLGEMASVKGELVAKTTAQKAFTVNTNNQSATVQLTTGVNAAGDNNVFVTYTANSTSVITPNKFNMVTKVNGTLDVDTITDFMEFKEAGSVLGISYMSANPSFRTFARVSSTKPTSVQAVVTTEDGAVSSRVNVTRADGSAVALTAANGGALIVEGADILRSAQDAGFTGTGLRFNATLYVKSAGTVDAVAYQTAGASGSQRYLPVNGATGGKKGL